MNVLIYVNISLERWYSRQHIGDHIIHCPGMILRKCLCDPVIDHDVERQALVAKQSPESIDSRSFHFEVADAVMADVKS